MPRREIIGTVTFDREFDVTQYSEFAAWNTQHRVIPGTYDVIAVYRPGGSFIPGSWPDITPETLLVTVDTVITDESNAPHYGGVPFGPSTKNNVGKPGRYTFQGYGYFLPEMLPGRLFGGHFTLADGWEIRHNATEISDGRIVRSAAAFRIG